jgi:hypothetical protein
LRESSRKEVMKPHSAFLPLVCCLLAVPAFAAEPNTLTAAEKSAGWRLLFDGQSLTGWRGFRTDAPGSAWTAKEGALMNAGKTRDLMTTGVFGDFDLSFE